MPFVFGIVGITLIVAGVRGQTNVLMQLLKKDFSGAKGGFLGWMIAIFAIGAIGYIKELSTITRMFMTLVVIGLLWSNKGFFSQFTQETQSNAQTNNTVTGGFTNPNLPTLPDFSTIEFPSTQPSTLQPLSGFSTSEFNLE